MTETFNEFIEIMQDLWPTFLTGLSILGGGLFVNLQRFAKRHITNNLTPNGLAATIEKVLDDYANAPEQFTKVVKGIIKSPYGRMGVDYLKLYLKQKIDEMEGEVQKWQDKKQNELTNEAKANEQIQRFREDINKALEFMNRIEEIDVE